MYIIKILIFATFCYNLDIYADISIIPKIIEGYSKAKEEKQKVVEIRSNIEKLVLDYSKSHSTNFAYLVYKEGVVLSEGISIFASKKAYKNPLKQATHKDETLLGFDNHIPIASCTKQMTAAGILRLQEAEKLNIHDHISKHLPLDAKYWKGKKPAWLDKVTLHHLLSQSSGIEEYQRKLFLDLKESEEELKSRLLQFAAKQKLKHNPGEKFDYSNTNYAILGIIIEEITKRPLGEFFEEEFFKPLGMKKTYLASLQEARDFAAGKLKGKYPKRYFIMAGKDPIDFLPMKENAMLPPLGDGGVISTMHDMAIWVSALHEGKVISFNSLDMMRKPHFSSVYKKYNTKANYGYAMHIHEMNGETIYSHGADALGLRGEYSYLGSQKMAAISISNLIVYIPQNVKIHVDEIQNQYKIDIKYFHESLLKTITK